MQKKSAYQLDKILFSLIGVLLIAVLTLSMFAHNTVVLGTEEEKYTVVENVVHERIESETAPIGVIDEFRFTIGELGHDETLSFVFYHQNAEVYLDDECVYSLKAEEGLVRTPGGIRAMIPLYEENAGKEVRVVLIPLYRNYQDKTPSFWIGSALAMYQEEMYGALPEMMLCLCVTFAGLILLCLAFYHTLRHTSINRLYTIGVMAVSAGVWRFSYSNFVYMLFPEHTAFIYTLSVVSLMMIALCMLNAADLQGKWKRIFRWVSRVYCAMYIVQFILQAAGVRDLRETLTLTHIAIVISSVALIVSNISALSRHGNATARGYSWLLGVGAIADLILYFADSSVGMIFFLLSTLIFSLSDGVRVLVRYMKQQKALEEMESQLALSRTMTMMSQIRSHFVFNVLNAISGMCKYDPEKADDTVVCFARYLRNNIDIMEDDKSIPFSAEIRQIEDYVMLEQIRFGDKIEFYTDIETDRFLIPPLILQPIIENAIKHGVSKKLTNGNIILRAREENGNIIITVEDDGVGFDMEELKKEKSVGLRNIRFRLAQLAGGTMDIVSEIGVGTTVTITMPKKEV